MVRDKIQKAAYDRERYRQQRELRLKQSKDYYENNRERIRAYKKKYNKSKGRDRLKAFFEFKKTLYCDHCGISGKDFHQILDFHHKDPSKKRFGISTKPYNFPNKTILKEMAKCTVLCANCHRIEHAKMLLNNKEEDKDD